jgi:hypothetical protein
MDADTFFYIASGADIKTTQARIAAAIGILFQKARLLKDFGSKFEHVYTAFVDVSGFAWRLRLAGRHVASLFFQRFGDKVGVGGALGGVFAAVEAVGVVNAVGAILAAVRAEGVGGGVKVEEVGAVDTKKGAVFRD